MRDQTFSINGASSADGTTTKVPLPPNMPYGVLKSARAAIVGEAGSSATLTVTLKAGDTTLGTITFADGNVGTVATFTPRESSDDYLTKITASSTPLTAVLGDWKGTKTPAVEVAVEWDPFARIS